MTQYKWEDLPEPKNCFTVRNAAMVNLNNRKIIQHYSANTKIVVTQKCVTEKGVYYRTDSAAHHYLNYAFEASALGLPNEFAPSAPSPAPSRPAAPKVNTLPKAKKQTQTQEGDSPKDGGEMKPFFSKSLLGRLRSWFK